MKAQSRSRKATQTLNTRGMPIVYDDYVIDPATASQYVTGVAAYRDPDMGSEFHLRVSGKREYVDAYAKMAQIVSLTIVPASQVNARVIKRVGTQFLKKQWKERMKQLTQLAKSGDVKFLANPEGVWQALRQQEAALTQKRLDLSVDRYIEIEMPPDLIKGETYYLAFQIDPEVAPGSRDIYSVPGQITAILGGKPTAYTIEHLGQPRGVVEAQGEVNAIYEYGGAVLIRDNEYVRWEQ